MTITNPKILEYAFLQDMVRDPYFPPHLVAKLKALLLATCARIETEQPTDIVALYAITHATTEQINDLADEFLAEGSEIETAARGAIGVDMEFIAKAYGFDGADSEALIAPRDW